MSNDHPFDRLIISKTMSVTVKRWPDEYYEVDFHITTAGGPRIAACIPLFSGKSPINHEKLGIIKSCLMTGLATIIELDFDEEPF